MFWDLAAAVLDRDKGDSEKFLSRLRAVAKVDQAFLETPAVIYTMWTMGIERRCTKPCSTCCPA